MTSWCLTDINNIDSKDPIPDWTRSRQQNIPSDCHKIEIIKLLQLKYMCNRMAIMKRLYSGVEPSDVVLLRNELV